MIQTRFPQCRLNLLTAFLIAATSATEQHQEAHPFRHIPNPRPNRTKFTDQTLYSIISAIYN
ncbi:hypothetical protein F528_0701, partial [Neisseria meningitidis 992008]